MWKEKLGDKITMIFGNDIHAGQYGMMIKVIEQEIIEKLIQEFETNSITERNYIQQLRDKWLKQ